jgi:hypothetical protein
MRSPRGVREGTLPALLAERTVALETGQFLVAAEDLP